MRTGRNVKLYLVLEKDCNIGNMKFEVEESIEKSILFVKETNLWDRYYSKQNQ